MLLVNIFFCSTDDEQRLKFLFTK